MNDVRYLNHFFQFVKLNESLNTFFCQFLKKKSVRNSTKKCDKFFADSLNFFELFFVG